MKHRLAARRCARLLTAAAWMLALPATASAEADAPALEDKPFAEAHIVLQLSDGEDELQSRVLNVANNLIKHYGGPDLVDLEIVAFGPGIALLYADSPHQERIASLMANGVRFVACMNTVETIERASGERPKLNPKAIPVQAGVAHIVTRVGQGFVAIRP